MPKYQINWKINKYVLADTLARAVFIWKLLVVETKFQIDWKSKIFLLQYQKKKMFWFSNYSKHWLNWL